MSLLLETIKLLDGNFLNLSRHEQRMNRALKTLCGAEDHVELEPMLNALARPETGLYKCRIVYDDVSREIEFVPYTPRPVHSLRVVEHDRISYEFKYTNRKLIDQLFALRKDCDDILIVKRGYVTDASYANVAFRRKNHWVTPWSALLKGTQRQKLIEQNILQEEDIRVEDIQTFDACRLINAMLEFDAPEIDVSNIVF